MIGKMLLPLILTLLMMNAMFLFMIELPQDMVTLSTYSETGGIDADHDILNASRDMYIDINGMSQVARADSSESSASDEPSIIPEPFRALIYGVGAAVGGAASGISTAFNIAGFFSRWLFLGIFGYVVWLDFLLPIELGPGVAAISMGLKGFLSLIIAKGLADIFLPLFTGWRGN
jgi:hypothetical protein